MSRLYRSRRDSKISGLCGGLAELLNVDSTLMRLVVLIAAFFSGGTVIPLYIIASFIIPKEPYDDSMRSGSSKDWFRYQQPRDKYQDRQRGHDRDNSRGRYTDRNYADRRYADERDSRMNEPPPSDSKIDEMMKDIEKKSLEKELAELRAKVAKYEKGDE